MPKVVKVLLFNILIFVICVCAFSFIYTGIYIFNRHITIDKSPVSYPGSTWTSEDGSITFVSVQHGRCEIKTEDGVVEFEITATLEGDLFLYPPGPEEIYYFDDPRIERWNWLYRGSNKFIAVVEKSTYFEKGTKIVFYRTPPTVEIA